ncbi:hypothetical protein N9L06_06265, partial [Mariniblastus sp.]|nr:hypothetical protein [Mariniblastus sp.]
EVNVNNGYELYGIADESTWRFGDEVKLIVLSGKSWPQEVGLDTLVDQIRESYDHKQYGDVVTTCDSLQEKIGKSDPNTMIAPYERTYAAEGMFGNLPFMLRDKVLQWYAESLFQLGNDEQAFQAFRAKAKSHLDQVGDMRYDSSSKKRDPSILPESLEAARTAILKASMLRPDDKETKRLAKERYLWARDVRCSSFFWVNDDDLERNGIQRALGECYDCVVGEAKKSSWLRGQVGSMTFRPKLNHSNNLQINKHGLYQAFVVVEVDGTLGRSGTLEIHVREDEDVLKPLDLNSAVPREPSFPFMIRRVRWTDSSDNEIKLSSKTMAPYKKK